MGRFFNRKFYELERESYRVYENPPGSYSNCLNDFARIESSYHRHNYVCGFIFEHDLVLRIRPTQYQILIRDFYSGKLFTTGQTTDKMDVGSLFYLGFVTKRDGYKTLIINTETIHQKVQVIHIITEMFTHFIIRNKDAYFKDIKLYCYNGTYSKRKIAWKFSYGQIVKVKEAKKKMVFSDCPDGVLEFTTFDYHFDDFIKFLMDYAVIYEKAVWDAEKV